MSFFLQFTDLTHYIQLYDKTILQKKGEKEKHWHKKKKEIRIVKYIIRR